MALYPKIQSPCPYKGRLSDIMDCEVCRLCKREVFDLSAMDDGQRVAFMQGCAGEVCVSYRVRPALAAAAIAVAAIVAPTAAAACSDAADVEWVVMGGIKDTAHVQYVQYDPADKAVPELPVVYDIQVAAAPDAKAAPAPKPPAAR